MSTYSVSATSQAGGEAWVDVFGARLPVDASPTRTLTQPGPAELMCSALAACILKNVARFSELLPFRYEVARVRVTAERQDSPPRFTRFVYRLELVTDEPPRRVELLHTNIRKFGTISGTLQVAAAVEGDVVVVEALDG